MRDQLVVGCVQFERRFGDKELNVRRATQLVREAADRGATLIALPELFSTGYFPGREIDDDYFDWAEPIPGPTTATLSCVAFELGVHIVAPLFEIDAGSGHYFNSAALLGPRGVLGTYRKRHIPGLRPPRMNEAHYFCRGDLGYPVFSVDGVSVGMSICYDRHFPETYRLLGHAGAAVVVSVNNTGSERSARMWIPEMQCAASSNGMYVAHVNAVGEEGGLFGRSLVCDPEGRVTDQLSTSEEGVLIRALDLDLVTVAREHYRAIDDTNWDDFGLSAPSSSPGGRTSGSVFEGGGTRSP